MKKSTGLGAPADLTQFVRLGPENALNWIRSGGRRESSLLAQARITLYLTRPRPCLVALLAHALGAAYAGSSVSWRVALSAALCYGACLLANLENAYTDLEEDYQNLPGRVFLLAGIGLPKFRLILVAINISMLSLAALIDLYCFAFMCIGLLLVHQYSFRPLRAKGRPFLGVLVFSSVTTYTFFIGALTEPGVPFLLKIVDYLRGYSTSPANSDVLDFWPCRSFSFCGSPQTPCSRMSRTSKVIVPCVLGLLPLFSRQPPAQPSHASA